MKEMTFYDRLNHLVQESGKTTDAIALEMGYETRVVDSWVAGDCSPSAEDVTPLCQLLKGDKDYEDTLMFLVLGRPRTWVERWHAKNTDEFTLSAGKGRSFFESKGMEISVQGDPRMVAGATGVIARALLAEGISVDESFPDKLQAAEGGA